VPFAASYVKIFLLMTGNEIRQTFLEYFEKHGHKIVHSSPVFPPNDPTILFTNAGMNQFKDVFLGNEKRDYTRAASSQKCIRAGGKHNDLDEVGKTARHHTFFEMLGNFSFGDYFKEDAINFAWDFLVNELKLDVNRLWFTVFAGDTEVPADDEAAELWTKAGAKPERILRFGRKDNFWQMADTGPCGPNSEINYYLGDEPENPKKNRADLVNAEEGDTTMEIWNLVFMQYNRVEISKGGYKLEPLPAPSVDTGAGLERMTVVMEGVHSNYETTLIKPIIEFIAELSSKKYEYESQEGFATRVVADHARTTAFSIADGILPGNEGRNYVLRKIMRRAIYHGREHLGFHDLFFYKVCDFVVDQMKDAYPELDVQREFIGKMVRLEEERFGNTLIKGSYEFNAIIAVHEMDEDLITDKPVTKKLMGGTVVYSNEHLIKSTPNPGAIPIKELASLYDTFGYPIDLIYVKLSELNKKIEDSNHTTYLLKELSSEDFSDLVETEIKLLQQNSEIGKTKQKETIKPIYTAMERTSVRSNFHGYEKTQVEDAKVIALVKDDQQTNELKEGEEGLIVLNETPFYAESGGQVGDTGTLFNQNANVKVFDTFAPIAGIVLHKSKIEKGSIKVGDEVTAMVDAEKRDATRRNHTATHLVHAALREVLGTHVKQAGSVVAPNYLRFDYTHYQPLSDAEIKDIEDLVNREILKNDAVNTNVMAIEEAISSGAMALFGEKYGSAVRVLSIGEGTFSKELCGGTHVRATGDIGSFKITADEAVASGVRRIRAITGFDAFERFREDERMIEKSLGFLKTQRDQLPNAIEKLQEELKRMRRENDELKMKIATGAIGSASSNGSEARDVKGVKVLAQEVENLDANAVRQLSDNLLNKIKSGVVVIGRKDEAKVSLIVRVSDDLTEKIKAGNVIKEIAPIIGGRGGGKADMAEGGGNLPEKLSEAIDASYEVIEKMLS